MIAAWHQLTLRMTSSPKMMVLMYSNSLSLVRISCMGLERLFLAMAQMPTTTFFREKEPQEPEDDVEERESEIRWFLGGKTTLNY